MKRKADVKRPIRLAVLVVMMASGALPFTGPARAADWPAYRGPDGNGISNETGLLSSWPDGGPRVLWRVPLGDGYSGISVQGDRLYTMYGRDGDELVVCLNAATGEEIWRTRTDSNRRDDQGHGPRSTPTLDEKRVFALGAAGRLVSLDAGSGETIWKLDLKEEFGARVPRWGVSTSPLVVGDLLLVDAGGRSGHSIIALEKSSGRLRWAAYSDEAGYSTPLPVTIGDIDQVLFFAATSLVSVSPSDGEVLWSVPWETAYDVNAAMPVFVPPDKVFVSSSYDVGAALFRIRASDGSFAVETIWKSKVMKNHFNSSILHGDHLYGFDNGTLKCIEAGTGKEIWRQRGFAKGSLLLADGHLIILSEDGLLVLAEATPSAYKEKGRVRIFDNRTWTMPSLSEGTLYLRDREELVALDLAG